MKKIYAILISSLFSTASFSQVVISSVSTPYSQDFDALANTGTTNAVTTLPTGWTFLESGTSGNTTYAADNGGLNGGNTYSYGTTGSTDRALGGLQSGSVIPTIGVSFSNNSGATITSITVSYTGEQWRLGAAGRVDRMDFQYSTDATALNIGTWTDENNLDFTAPVTTGTTGALNGNVSPNKTAVSFTLTGLNIPDGSTFWFRWNDLNATGSDDGLAVDDFSITFNGMGTPSCVSPVSQPTTLVFPTVTATSVSGSFTATAADDYLVVRSLSSTLSATPVDGTTYVAGNSLGGGTVVSSGPTSTFTDNGLAASTTYYYFIFAYNNTACIGGPKYNTVLPLTDNTTTSGLPACTNPPSPTALNLTPANNTIAGNFTGSGASRYMVIISTSSSLGTNVLDGTSYPVGSVIGTGTVISNSAGAGTTFTASGLNTSTTYYFFVYAVNTNCTGEPFYSALSLNGSAATTNVGSGIPPGYYNAAAGLTCGNLKDALSTIITSGQVTLSYSNLDDIQMPIADTIRSDDGLRSIIWDIYTNNSAGPEPFEFNSSQNPSGGFCGGTGSSGCWNKEHTFPQSWFGSQSPTVADLFVVRPTDITVNGKRGNIPYSIVGGSTTYQFPATTSTYPGVPILDKVGPSTAAGISVSSAFEPSNGVKGDVARDYFYILTRYQNNLSSWASANNGSGIETVVDGTTGGGTYPSFQLPYLSMMYNWHVADPVDAREINYNNLVYSQQNNRNPYIDHPEYVALVFQCTGVVPVTLIDFTAQKNNDIVLLRWYATQETGFSRYDVERSIDAVNFNKIGEVTGQNLANYSFNDNNLPKNAVVYYRLKMVDLDGRSRYSKIVSVRLNNNLSNAIVYPNPAADILHIKLLDALQTNSDLVITDITGRIVKKQTANANTFSIDIDVKAFPAGRYFIKLINSRQVINESFVVVK